MTDRDDRRSRAWAMLRLAGQKWQISASDFDRLSWEEVAGNLAGLRDPSLSAGLHCLAGHQELGAWVTTMLHGFALRLSTREEWDLRRGPGPIRTLAELAVFEMTGPTLQCMDCDGEGRIEKPGATRWSCDTCEGTGRILRTQRSQADHVGVDARNWHRTWKGRYQAVYGELQNWLSVADEYLARQLSKRRQVRA